MCWATGRYPVTSSSRSASRRGSSGASDAYSSSSGTRWPYSGSAARHRGDVAGVLVQPDADRRARAVGAGGAVVPEGLDVVGEGLQDPPAERVRGRRVASARARVHLRVHLDVLGVHAEACSAACSRAPRRRRGWRTPRPRPSAGRRSRRGRSRRARRGRRPRPGWSGSARRSPTSGPPRRRARRRGGVGVPIGHAAGLLSRPVTSQAHLPMSRNGLTSSGESAAARSGYRSKSWSEPVISIGRRTARAVDTSRSRRSPAWWAALMSTASPLEARNVTAVEVDDQHLRRVGQQLGRGRAPAIRPSACRSHPRRRATRGARRAARRSRRVHRDQGGSRLGGVEQRRSPPTSRLEYGCAGAVVAAPGRGGCFLNQRDPIRTPAAGARPGGDRGEMVTERRPGSSEPDGRAVAAGCTDGACGVTDGPAGCTDGACEVHGRRLRGALMGPARPYTVARSRARARRGVPQRTAVSCRLRGRALRWSAMFGVDSDRSGAHSGTDDGHRLPAVLHTAPAAVLIIDPRRPPGRLRQPRGDRADRRTGAAARRHRRVERRRGPHRPRRTADERDRLAAVARRGGGAGGG